MKSKATSFLLGLAAAGFIAGCSTTPAPGGTAAEGGFAQARKVIERNCVHCHGANRLATMPSYNDTGALAKLRGPGKWIVPGQPEASRFLQVVTLSNSQPGAMPPTGHAITKDEVATLRAWIAAGAPLPEGPPILLTPHGTPPRSR